MAVISGPTAVAVAVPVQPARVQHAGTGGFAVPLPVGAPEARPGVARTGMAAAIGSSMLALQEQVGRDSADEDGRRQGHRVLDELARLQRALLGGGDAASLETLAELARAEPGNVDPALAGVLSSIRLRARIELERRSLRREHGQDSV